MAFDTQPQSTICQINVVPLVDVMLVLLVIFMVTAPIIQQGVAVDLPQTKAGPLAGDSTPLVVTIDAQQRVFLHDEPIELASLSEKLEAVQRNRPGQDVFLRADRTIPYGTVVEVMAAIQAAGITNLGMVTEPPSE